MKKTKTIIIYHKKKIIPIKVKNLSKFEMCAGLMFKQRNTSNLLFNRRGNWGIHSFFVFFPFLAIWLNEKNQVIEYEIVKPFSFSITPKSKFAKLIEIPLNKRNKTLIRSFPSVQRNI